MRCWRRLERAANAAWQTCADAGAACPDAFVHDHAIDPGLVSEAI